MTLPTWTERNGCPIYSGVRAGCEAKSRPNFSIGYKGSNMEMGFLYIISLPITIVTDTIILPVSIPFGLGNSIYYNWGDWKEAKIYEKKFPLHYASGYNQIEKVKTLLEQGKDVNAKDLKGWTPVNIALNRKNFEIAILFLESGSVLDELTIDFYEYLVKSKYKNIELISKHQPNLKNDLLYFSVYNGNLEFTKYLINKKANVNYIYNDHPILVWAYIKGHLDIIALLLENGANVNIRYEYGGIHTPFTRLIDDFRWHNITENLRLIRLFIKYGANINKTQEDRSAAIMLFDQLLGTPDNDIILLLFEHGFNVNEKGYYGKSPVQMATEKGDLKVVKYLNEHGASIKK